MGNADGGQTRRFKIIGILRDAMRQKSVGIIEENPEKEPVKYARPAAVIACAIVRDWRQGAGPS